MLVTIATHSNKDKNTKYNKKQIRTEAVNKGTRFWGISDILPKISQIKTDDSGINSSYRLKVWYEIIELLSFFLLTFYLWHF